MWTAKEDERVVWFPLGENASSFQTAISRSYSINCNMCVRQRGKERIGRRVGGGMDG